MSQSSTDTHAFLFVVFFVLGDCEALNCSLKVQTRTPLARLSQWIRDFLFVLIPALEVKRPLAWCCLLPLHAHRNVGRAESSF